MNSKRVFATILALALILTMFPVTALGAESKPEFDIVGGVLIGYNGPGGDVVIPDGVTSIAGHVFAFRDDVTSVTIPEGVTTIQNCGIYFCRNLVSVTLPASLTDIKWGVFSSCPKLANITVAEGNPAYCTQDGVLFTKDKTQLLRYSPGKADTVYTVPDTVTRMGDYAFENSGNLTRVILPEGLTELSDDLFSGCGSLSDITIPSSVVTIGNCAFQGCRSLAGITIPEGVTTIGPSAFWSCSALADVTIPSSVTTIDGGAFADCDALTSVVIPDTVQTLGTGIFKYCDNLSSVTLPSHLTTIGKEMFYCCKSLTSMNIPAGIRSIGENAFASSGLTSVSFPQGLLTIGNGAFAWTPLASVDIPEGVTSVGEEAFRGCGQLASVDFPTSLTQLGNKAFSLCESLERVELPQKATNLGTYLFLGCHSLTEAILPAGLTAIPEAMFESTGLTHITIPNTVTRIGSRAFQDCHVLEEIDIPAGVTSIGSSAFADCDALTEIVLPPKLAIISDRLLEGCDALASVTIPDGVIQIGWDAFQDCLALTTIELPGGLLYIGREAFHGCAGLTDISVAEGTGNYSSDDGVLFDSSGTGLALYPMGKPGTYTIPDGVSAIWSYAFDVNLTSVTLPDSLSEFDPSAFCNCPDLTDISVSEDHPNYTSVDGVLFSKDMSTLLFCPQGRTGSYVVPDSVTSIAPSAFYQCAKLSEVTLPETVSSIGELAFCGCSGLTHVNIPSSITTIEPATFARCSSLTEIQIPDSVTTIGISAFSGCSGLTEMVVPDSVTTLDGFAFDECTNLEKVTLGSGVTELKIATFQGCPYLSELVLRGDVTSFERSTFARCRIKNIYYGGSEQEWEEIPKSLSAETDMGLLLATIHYNCTWPGVLTKSLFEIDTGKETYTGEAITKTITSALTEGTDYAVSYADNVEVGTATITINGIGEYSGTLTYTFRISPVGGDPVALPWQAFVVDTQDEFYTGNPITKTIATNLVEGVDYTVTYANNVEVGTATLIIQGMGGYTGGWRYTFQIVEPPKPDPVVLNAKMFSVDTAPEAYTGSAVTKSISGADGDRTLVEGVDYTVTYADNVEVGAATVTITGQGDYTGTLLYSFSVTPATLTKGMFQVNTASAQYTGSPITKTVTSSLKQGTDFEVEYQDNLHAGEAKVQITGKGNYTGTLNYTFQITRKPISANMFQVGTANEIYTGSEITKTVTSKDLTLDTDYTVTYQNNVAVGTATATITGVGNYTGTLNYNFLITRRALAKDMFYVDTAEEFYTGSPITKAVSSTLAQGTDYTVAYADNVDAGTATITITGKGNYTGALTYTFEIVEKKSLARNMFTVDTDGVYYTGNAVTKKITSALVEDTDYTVMYTNNVEVGTATITIMGKGDYIGTLTYTFRIVEKKPPAQRPTPITSDMFQVDLGWELATNEPITKEVTSAELIPGIDYVVSYEDNVNIGAATIYITGIGDYIGTLDYRFLIVHPLVTPVEITSIREDMFYVECIEFPEKYYTGNPIQPVVTERRGTGLSKGIDYTVTYIDNVEIGTATIIVKGKKKYIGTLEYHFEIIEKPTPSETPTPTLIPLTEDMFTIDLCDEVYTGYVITKEIVSELIRDTDYTEDYTSAVSPGTATLTIKGRGKYTGTLTYHYQILSRPMPAPLRWAFFLPFNGDEVYTGQPITKNIVAQDGKKTLVENVDYVVIYANNVEIGHASITINGMGAYNGSLLSGFEIVDSLALPSQSPNPSDPPPAQSGEPGQSPAPSQSSAPTQSTPPSGSPKPSESAQPSGSAQPSDSPKPSESAKPSESPKPSGFVEVTGVKLSKGYVELETRDTWVLTATVTPGNASNQGVYWTSNDTSVVTVDSRGRITGVRAGQTTVVVTTVDGGYTAACTVRVTAKSSSSSSSSGGGGGGGGGGGSTSGGGSSGGGASGGSAPGGSTSGGSAPGGSTTPATSTGQLFADVVPGSWYEPGVTYVVAKGLFQGVAQGIFAPQENMTRAMLMTVLARLDGQDTGGGITWYAKGMAWAMAQGISDGSMPEGNITREQMVTMLYRYAKATGTDGDLSAFVDSTDISSWAKEAMTWAVSQGIITGKDGARLDPQGTATRAEVATILQRFVEKLGK